MKLESSKNLGGIGALLLFIGNFPYISYLGVVSFIGLILVLFALYSLGKYYKEQGIFKNALAGIGAGIVGFVLAVAIGIAIVLPNITDFLMKIYPSWDGSWNTITSLSGMIPSTSNIGFGDILPFIAAAIAVFAILWVFLIIATFFARRSFNILSTKTSVGLFSTAGLLLFLGALLTIILIGFLLMWIAVLLIAIAFFQIKS
jgi:uncharacterized membrane protein